MSTVWPRSSVTLRSAPRWHSTTPTSALQRHAAGWWGGVGWGWVGGGGWVGVVGGWVGGGGDRRVLIAPPKGIGEAACMRARTCARACVGALAHDKQPTGGSPAPLHNPLACPPSRRLPRQPPPTDASHPCRPAQGRGVTTVEGEGCGPRGNRQSQRAQPMWRHRQEVQHRTRGGRAQERDLSLAGHTKPCHPAARNAPLGGPAAAAAARALVRAGCSSVRHTAAGPLRPHQRVQLRAGLQQERRHRPRATCGSG